MEIEKTLDMDGERIPEKIERLQVEKREKERKRNEKMSLGFVDQFRFAICDTYATHYTNFERLKHEEQKENAKNNMYNSD